MLQVPEYIRLLVPYVPGKPIEETQREFGLKRVIKLASNENPLGPSPKALAAAKSIMKELNRYPDAAAYHLKQALSAHLKVSPTSLIIGNGSNEIIDFLIRTYCVAGDAIVTSQAAFIAYKICAQIHGVSTLEAPMGAEMRFDLKKMADLVRKNQKAKLVFIANPNNPTGTYLNADEMREFLREIQAIRHHDVLVVLDYAYWEYVTAKDLPDPLELMREFPNVIVLRTFSKIYGLAGFRIGYGVGSPEIMTSLEKVRQPFNISAVGLAAAEAAVADKAYVARAKKANTQGMAFWEKSLKKLGVPFWPSQGNFLLADAKAGFGKSGHDLYLSLLKQGVILRPVTNYGLPHAIRISVGTMQENKLAVKALERESAQHSKEKEKKGIKG